MIRNLLKRKTFTTINLLGLSSGMAVCLLLALYIQNELGYDKFHDRGDQVYRLALERMYPSHSNFRGLTPPSIGQAIRKEFPEVLQSVRVFGSGSSGATINAGDKVFEDKNILSVDSNFFRVFTGRFLQGDANTALQSPGSAVVNETTAKRLFGSAENALHKPIVLNGQQHFTISGVCLDWPEKSHLPFNLLLSTAGFGDSPDYIDLYNYTYLLLDKNAKASALEAKFQFIIDKYVAPTIEKGFGESYEHFRAEGNGYRYFLQPLQKIHLYSNLQDELRPGGSIGVVYLFTAIAAFILFLACINFINLSTALSIDRAREVGIRKTFGSGRTALIRQFLAESVFFSLLSMLLAIGLATLFLPLLNQVAGATLSLVWFLDPLRILLIIGFTIFIGLAAGLYPAFVLSNFRPITVLKGRFKSSTKGRALRNGLVVFQFTISVILIICTIVVNSQMQFVLGDKLGFRKDHIIGVGGMSFLPNARGRSFMNEIERINGVEEVSKCTGMPDGSNIATCAMQVAGTRVSRTEKTIFTDDRYLDLFGLQLKEGRFFSKAFAGDSVGLVLNESAVADLGLKNPLGAHLTSTEYNFNPPKGAQTVYTVIGVIRDYHFESLHSKIAPLIVANADQFYWGTAAVRISGDHFTTAIAEMEKTWKQFEPKHSFQYSFLDQNLAAQYKADRTAQRIFTAFSLLAIFIACIGLLGLATYSTLQRTKEIGIRKVLGATTGNILRILSKDFLSLVVLSALIAFPIAWWVMQQWLQNFAYRVTMGWWVFVFAGMTASLIALVTISFQAVRAAVANPVKSLRSE